MANNRLFLVHIPTGVGCYLGKRMALGWYLNHQSQETAGDRLGAFFDVIQALDYGGGSQDDFAIAMELQDDVPAGMAITNWHYGERRDDGLTNIVIRKEP